MPDTDALIAAMRGRTDALRGLGYRVRFDLDEGGDSILLDATGGGVAVEPATAADAADCVLALSAANLEKLMAGKLSPMLAFATGRLKVEGSKGVAMKLASLLDDA
jgi:putative sterol carrier protein